jgi:hypothetical protein
MCPRSAFIPIRNGRTASFTIPAVRPSLSLSPRRRRSTSRLRLRSLMPRPRHGTHLRSCKHPRAIARSHPIRESGSRSCCASTLQRGTRRRRRAWDGGNRNSPGLVPEFGEQNGAWFKVGHVEGFFKKTAILRALTFERRRAAALRCKLFYSPNGSGLPMGQVSQPDTT